MCKGLNLGLSVHVERDLVIKVSICVPPRRRRDSSSVAQVQAKVRAAFAAGSSGKKKLNKREKKDARGPRPSIFLPNRVASRRTCHAPRSSRPRPTLLPSAY